MSFQISASRFFDGAVRALGNVVGLEPKVDKIQIDLEGFSFSDVDGYNHDAETRAQIETIDTAILQALREVETPNKITINDRYGEGERSQPDQYDSVMCQPDLIRSGGPLEMLERRLNKFVVSTESADDRIIDHAGAADGAFIDRDEQTPVQDLDPERLSIEIDLKKRELFLTIKTANSLDLDSASTDIHVGEPAVQKVPLGNLASGKGNIPVEVGLQILNAVKEAVEDTGVFNEETLSASVRSFRYDKEPSPYNYNYFELREVETPASVEKAATHMGITPLLEA